jgi:hypothetical protein
MLPTFSRFSLLMAVLLAACARNSQPARVRDASIDPAIAAAPPLTANDYVARLHKGLDVDWSKTGTAARTYSERSVINLKARGVDHVRIRVKDDVSDDLFANLEVQIADCIRHGMTPILAYQGGDAKEDPTDAMRDAVVAWWTRVAAHFASYPFVLSFDMLIEVTDALSKDAAKLNDWYARILPTIRATNPKRVVFMSPRIRSNPLNLTDLVLPTESREYIAAEWHFYASGPSKDPNNTVKRWITGSPEERRMITDKIDAAIQWQTKNNVPTWVGAWMANDYNEGNSYSIDEQLAFASFMACSLEKAKVPFAINQENKYYDAKTEQWISPDVIVFDAIMRADNPRRVPCAP